MIKMPSLFKLAIFFFVVVYVKGDDIDNNLRKGVMLKLLREMVNQTNSDSLNLPANSTSIRENITDTFKCENRTYGYYADVDNDCQIFHVCLPSQTPSGRNVTYRWSFICPNETIFNQEVLTCTRPRDAIDCEDSPMYYDVNMDIGKITNDTENQPIDDKKISTHAGKDKINPNVEMIKVKDRKKHVNRKKQNIIQKMMKEVVNDIINEEQIEELYSPDVEETVLMNDEVLPIAVDEVMSEDVEAVKPIDTVVKPIAVKEVIEVDPMDVIDVKPLIVDEVNPIVHDIGMEKVKKVLSKEEKEEDSNLNLNSKKHNAVVLRVK